MLIRLHQKKLSFFIRISAALLVLCFLGTTVIPPSFAQETFLPRPGTMVGLSQAYTPAQLLGLRTHKENPFRLDFILDTGETPLSLGEVNAESEQLIKYFLTALTVPEKDLWVNLSPHEKNRIIPDELSQTAMGKELLIQDYFLKQLSSSLSFPENELGQQFWARVSAEAKEQYGMADIPVDTLNRIWIVPDKAVVYENNDSVYIGESHLKVMLEEDFKGANAQSPATSAVPSVMREMIIPRIEHEVNTGKSFVKLRQMYSAMILAAWYKQTLKDSVLGRYYVDGKKMAGIDIPNEDIKQKVYAQYLEAFKKGAYSLIREDVDQQSGEIIVRKYFSGGFKDETGNILERRVSSSKVELSRNIKKGLVAGMAVLIGVVLTRPLPLSNTPLIELRKEVQAQSLETPVLAQNGTEEEQQLVKRRGYWLSLANENFTEVFERAQEFIHEPFAYEILEKAAFSAPTGPFMTSTRTALKYFDNYVEHPRSWELFELMAKLYGVELFDQLDSLISQPFIGKVFDILLKHHPNQLFHLLGAGAGRSYMSLNASNDQILNILKQSHDPVTKKILEIVDLNEHWDTKTKLSALLDSLVRGELSLPSALEIVKDDNEFTEALIKILGHKDYLAGGAIYRPLFYSSRSFYEKGSEQLPTGQFKKTIENMPLINVLYLMSSSGRFSTELSDPIDQYLFDWLIPQLRSNPQVLEDFIEREKTTGRSLRFFFRLAIEFDRLEEILLALDSPTADTLLKHFAWGREQDSEYEKGSAPRISNLAVMMMLSSHLLQRPDTASQNAEFYQQMFKKTKQEIMTLETRYFLSVSNRYLKGGFFSDLIDAKITESAHERPDGEFFYSIREFILRPIGLEVFIIAAKNNPISAANRLVSLKTSDDPVDRRNWQNIIDSDPTMKILFDIIAQQYDVNLTRNKEISWRITLLLDRLATGEMTIAQARELVRDPFAFLRELVRIQDKPNHLGNYAITFYLRDFYLRTVFEINDLHEQPDAVRFKSLEQATPLDIYMLMVEGEQEIFTSSFNGIFNRLLIKMKESSISGEQLLQQVGYNRFRSFVRLLTEFGRLNDFLPTMDEAGQQELLNKFARGIEKEKNPLYEAVVVAETFGMLKDKGLLMMLQKIVHEEYSRVAQEKHDQGMVLYGLLSGLFGQEAVIDVGWFEKMAEKYPLVKISEITSNKLFNARGENIQQHFFYYDETDRDGQKSFEHFIATYKNDKQWDIIYEENYVIIVGSESGKKVMMLANKPEKEKQDKGIKDIAAYLKTHGLQRQMVVHRGHSFHASKTISQLQPTDSLVWLGSCGGFKLVSDVLDKSSQAHILSTKGTGSMYVNDPLLKMLNNAMFQGDIDWASFWASAENRISSTYFKTYVAPHKNLGAFFIKAFNSMTKPAGEQVQDVSLNDGDDLTNLTNQQTGRSALNAAANSYIRLANVDFLTNQDFRTEFFQLYSLMITWYGRFDLISFFNDYGQEQGLPAVSQVISAIAQHGMLEQYNAAVDGSLGRRLAQGLPAASAASSSLESNPGGIDLDAGKLNLEIKRNAPAVVVPNFSEFENFVPMDGLTPLIINVTPITNLPMILGLSGDGPVESSFNLVSQK